MKNWHDIHAHMVMLCLCALQTGCSLTLRHLHVILQITFIIYAKRNHVTRAQKTQFSASGL